MSQSKNNGRSDEGEFQKSQFQPAGDSNTTAASLGQDRSLSTSQSLREDTENDRPQVSGTAQAPHTLDNRIDSQNRSDSWGSQDGVRSNASRSSTRSRSSPDGKNSLSEEHDHGWHLARPNNVASCVMAQGATSDNHAAPASQLIAPLPSQTTANVNTRSYHHQRDSDEMKPIDFPAVQQSSIRLNEGLSRSRPHPTMLNSYNPYRLPEPQVVPSSFGAVRDLLLHANDPAAQQIAADVSEEQARDREMAVTRPSGAGTMRPPPPRNSTAARPSLRSPFPRPLEERPAVPRPRQPLGELCPPEVPAQPGYRCSNLNPRGV